MMETPLTLDKLLDRAVSLFGDRELVTKRADESLHRYTYADAYERICRLAHALDELGVCAAPREGRRGRGAGIGRPDRMSAVWEGHAAEP